MTRLWQKLLPTFSEIEFFVVGYGLLLPAFYYLDEVMYSLWIRYKIAEMLSGTHTAIYSHLFFLSGILIFILFTVYHALSKRKKFLFESKFLFYCMIPIHLAIIVTVGLHNLDTVLGKIIFLQSGLGLWLLYHAMPKNKSDQELFFKYIVKDEDTKRSNVFLALCLSVLLFVLMVHVLGLNWFLTFSAMYLYVPILVALVHDHVVIYFETPRFLLSNTHFSVVLLLPLLGLFALNHFSI